MYLKISPTIISKYSYQVNQLERELEQLKQRFRTTQSEVRPYYLSTLIEITNIVTYDLYIDRCKFFFLSNNEQKYCYWIVETISFLALIL